MSELTPSRACACPGCGAAVFAAGELEATPVNPGDLSVCLHCGASLIFNADKSFRRATEQDLLSLKIDAGTWELIHRLRDLVALRQALRNGKADSGTQP